MKRGAKYLRDDGFSIDDVTEEIMDLKGPLHGDFCYVVWFDDIQDAHHFRNIMAKRLGQTVAWVHTVRKYGVADYAVFWDIGAHP
jgi:malonyl CoA-acyl carrier protein transacylase